MLLRIDAHRGGKIAGRIRQKNEQLILAAAEVEFADHGYKGATMNGIARRAGLPKANLHYYFTNKLALYAAVLSGILELWDGTLNELRAEDDPAVVLPAYIATKIRFSREYPLASRIFAIEILSGAPNLIDYFNDEYRAWFRSRTDVFRHWSEAGKIAAVDPAHLIFLLWSSTQHYADFGVQIRAALGRETLDDADFQNATGTLTQIVLRGCGVAVAMPDTVQSPQRRSV